MLGENDAGTQAGTVGAIIAFPNAVEAVAGGDNPGVCGGALQVFAEILEDGGVLGRQRGKIVDGLVDASRETCGSDVVPQDSAVHYLGEKSGLRNQLSHQVRDILLPLGGKRLLITPAATKRDDHNFSLFRGD